jgi:glyoxylase-like metal-dependent hydrolase (beta-lactamase superfamily II)
VLTRDVAKGVHRIEDAYTNWFLVEDGGRITVIDTGVPTSWNSLLEALQALEHTVQDIQAVVLTHGHFDHIGFAERARSELGTPIWLHTNDVPIAQHPRQYAHAMSRLPYLLNPKSLPIAASLIATRAFWPRPIAEVARFDESVDSLSVPGSPKVLFTPGHTLGHCAFHFPDRDVLIAGDAIVTLDPYTGEPGPQVVSGAATADPERALASLDVIADTQASLLLTGHGEPWARGTKEAVDLARSAGLS